jgi:hypothetical protein
LGRCGFAVLLGHRPLAVVAAVAGRRDADHPPGLCDQMVDPLLGDHREASIGVW